MQHTVMQLDFTSTSSLALVAHAIFVWVLRICYVSDDFAWPPGSTGSRGVQHAFQRVVEGNTHHFTTHGLALSRCLLTKLHCDSITSTLHGSCLTRQGYKVTKTSPAGAAGAPLCTASISNSSKHWSLQSCSFLGIY